MQRDPATLVAPPEGSRESRADTVLAVLDRSRVSPENREDFHDFTRKAQLTPKQTEEVTGVLRALFNLTTSLPNRGLDPERQELFRRRLKKHVEAVITTVLTPEQLSLFDNQFLADNSELGIQVRAK